MTRRGRPSGSLGPFTLAALELAVRRPVSWQDVHVELGFARLHAQETVRSLTRSGLVIRVGDVRTPGVARPSHLVRATSVAAATVDEKLAALKAWSHAAVHGGE